MKKYGLLLMALIFSVALVASASAEIKLKDVPADHWAASAVYDLVKMGVTNGYPDGTFRGNEKMTRYETAVFLSKLAQAIGTEDLKADIKALKDEIAALKGPGGGLPFSGGCQLDWKIGNLLTAAGSTQGAVANYRLKLSTTKYLGEDDNIKVNLDTMDFGWASTSGGVLATELLDIESNLRLNLAAFGFEKPVDLTLTYGPGVRQHTDTSGVLPSEDGMIYERPDTGILASTSMWGAEVAGMYIIKDHAASGKVNLSQVTGAIGYSFGNNLKLEATGDYLSSGAFSASAKDVRATIALAAPLAHKVEAVGKLGLSGTSASQIMLEGEVALDDLWETGTVANIRVSRIGAAYLDTGATFGDAEADMAGLDTFYRPLENATVNLGGKLVQSVSEGLSLVGKGDLRLDSNYSYSSSKGRLTAQGGISYTVAANTNLDAYYRVNQDKSTNDTTDMAALGLLYNF